MGCGGVEWDLPPDATRTRRRRRPLLSARPSSHRKASFRCLIVSIREYTCHGIERIRAGGAQETCPQSRGGSGSIRVCVRERSAVPVPFWRFERRRNDAFEIELLEPGSASPLLNGESRRCVRYSHTTTCQPDQPVSQSASQSACLPVSQSACLPVSQSASQPVSQPNYCVLYTDPQLYTASDYVLHPSAYCIILYAAS